MAKRYIVDLTENISNQAVSDLASFGVQVLQVNTMLPNLAMVETSKTTAELESYFLIDTAVEAEGAA